MVRAILWLLMIFVCDVKCEQRNCQMIPYENSRGDTGYCCVFKSTRSSQPDDLSNVQKMIHKHISNVPVEPANDETRQFNWNAYQSFTPGMENKTPENKTTDIVFPNLERGYETTTTTIKNTTAPDLGDRFNINAPVTCTQGYRKTAKGCIKVY